MEAIFKNIKDSLHAQLRQIVAETDNRLLQARHSFGACRQAMETLNDHVKTRGFRDRAQEVHFFKTCKPTIHKELVYWKETILLELGNLRKRKGDHRKYIRLQQVYYGDFLERYRSLCDYYLLGRTDMDERLFVSGNLTGLPGVFEEASGNSFHCAAEQIIAHMLAYTDIIDKLERSDHLPAPTTGGKVSEARLRWTGSKAQFIELAYGIHASGVLNGGHADIRQVFGALSRCFGIDVTNYYSYFNAMVLRKKDKTPFLHHMAVQLVLRMDERTGMG